MGGQFVIGFENVLMDDSNLTDHGIRMVTPDSIAGRAFRLLGKTIGRR